MIRSPNTDYVVSEPLQSKVLHERILKLCTDCLLCGVEVELNCTLSNQIYLSYGRISFLFFPFTLLTKNQFAKGQIFNILIFFYSVNTKLNGICSYLDPSLGMSTSPLFLHQLSIFQKKLFFNKLGHTIL